MIRSDRLIIRGSCVTSMPLGLVPPYIMKTIKHLTANFSFKTTQAKKGDIRLVLFHSLPWPVPIAHANNLQAGSTEMNWAWAALEI